MEERVGKVLVLFLLLLNSFLDWKKREISLFSLAGFGAVGIGLNFWLEYQSLAEAAGGVALGILLLAIAFFTREAIGFGDGLLICTTGIYLGFWENLNLLSVGTLCCGVALGISVLLGKVKLADRVPLVPFFLLAFIGRMIF